MNSTMLDYYFKSIKNIPLLDRNEEIELAKRIEKGDKSAKNLMIQSNLRLAISVAKKYSKYGTNLEDLIQECNIGLIKAVEKFDWRKGYKFSTYGSWWIKQSATRYLSNDSSILKIPSHTIALSRKILSVIQDYKEEFNIDPEPTEIADLLGIDIEHVKQSMEAIKARYSISTDAPIDNLNQGNSRTLAELMPDYSLNPEDNLLQELTKQQILTAFKTLNKREELVLRLRFGIFDVLEDDSNVYEIKEEE